jgi:hypothetical protein
LCAAAEEKNGHIGDRNILHAIPSSSANVEVISRL